MNSRVSIDVSLTVNFRRILRGVIRLTIWSTPFRLQSLDLNKLNDEDAWSKAERPFSMVVRSLTLDRKNRTISYRKAEENRRIKSEEQV